MPPQSPQSENWVNGRSDPQEKGESTEDIELPSRRSCIDHRVSFVVSCQDFGVDDVPNVSGFQRQATTADCFGHGVYIPRDSVSGRGA